MNVRSSLTAVCVVAALYASIATTQCTTSDTTNDTVLSNSFSLYWPTNTFTNTAWIGDHIKKVQEDPEIDFWQAYSDTIKVRGMRIVEEEIGTVAQLRMTMNRLRMGHEWFDYYNDVGKGIMNDILAESSREVCVSILPIDDWRDTGSSLFEHVAGSIFRGTVGNTEEEHMNHVSSLPYAPTLDESWWKTKNGNGLIAYGAKPLRSSPYVYATFGIGHVSRKPVILDLRVYSMLFDSQIGNPKVKVSSIIPLSDHSHIMIGGSLYPMDIGNEDHRPKGSIRYAHALFKPDTKTYWSAGIESDGRETLASIVIAKAW